MQVLEVEINILKPCTSYVLVTLVDAAIKGSCLTIFILSGTRFCPQSWKLTSTSIYFGSKETGHKQEMVTSLHGFSQAVDEVKMLLRILSIG